MWRINNPNKKAVKKFRLKYVLVWLFSKLALIFRFQVNTAVIQGNDSAPADGAVQAVAVIASTH